VTAMTCASLWRATAAEAANHSSEANHASSRGGGKRHGKGDAGAGATGRLSSKSVSTSARRMKPGGADVIIFRACAQRALGKATMVSYGTREVGARHDPAALLRSLTCFAVVGTPYCTRQILFANPQR
jgi:hypothetical protein